MPLVGIAPIGGRWKFEQHRQESRIGNDLISHASGVSVFFVADRFPIEIGRRDVEHHRLRPISTRHRRCSRVAQIAIWLRVQFVDDADMQIQAVLGAASADTAE